MANSISGKDGKREMICSFCGRSQSQVDQLIIGPGVNICKDCIDMCYSALYKDGNVPEPPRATPERRAAASRGHSGVDPLADVNIMTPAEIKAGLDQYVIGQDDAKRVLAVSVYNHYKRILSGQESHVELQKSNVLMLGPSGTGKTLLARAVEQARALGIPVSARISPRVAVNRRAVTRFGCCIRRGGEYVIELSERLLEAEERACMQTLAHEVLHTCPGCRNHGALWKEYAARMNGAYGYAISRTGTCEALGVADVRPVRYRLVCERCGQGVCRSRRSPLVDHPERYRCRCGGVLRRSN